MITPKTPSKKLAFWALSVAGFALTGCGSQPEREQTLGDIDLSTQSKSKADVQGKSQNQNEQASTANAKEKTNAAVKQAYYEYIKSADEKDEQRAIAARRIAELELSNQSAAPEEAGFDQTLRSTINLLNKALADFPNAEGNDRTLYQLAKAYDQLGESEKAVATLEKLVRRYPDTEFFVEAKFRIAEFAFINGQYFKAEDAYTDVIKQASADEFVEKGYFKRGWARYKQELYPEAISDFYSALELHQYEEEQSINEAEKEQIDEYFRAIALAFIYQGLPSSVENYFKKQKNQLWVYPTYQKIADLLLKQERYSDAVAIYKNFATNQKMSSKAVLARIDAIEVWKSQNFFSRYVEDFESFYLDYNPSANFWQQSQDKNKDVALNQAKEFQRSNIVQLAAYYHRAHRKKPSAKNSQLAELWYQRYLSDFKQSARQDKIYQLYAELLLQNKQYKKAYGFYELAAFDGDIVLDKESAYQTVYLSNRLFQEAPAEQQLEWLNKHLNYAAAYAELYAGETKSNQIVVVAVQLAFKNKQYQKAIDLANLLSDKASAESRKEVALLRAQSYFNLSAFEDAELMYRDLLAERDLTSAERAEIENKLALSYYRQAEAARAKRDSENATRFFLSVYSETPNSELAPTAVYDAIALFLEGEQWSQAITYLNLFKSEYPKHPYQQDIAKKLSFAYLKADRSLDAAREFEQLSSFVETEQEKMAALWQAAELYYKKKELNSALRAYKQYAHTYKRPYPQNMEAMNILSDIYNQNNDQQKRAFWLRKLVQSDQKSAAANKTERTQFLAANAAFELALLRLEDFHRARLKLPLAQSLKVKKQAMQDAVKYFGLSSSYGHQEFVTQATYQIASIYKSFARALLESERPKNLSADELEQYGFLLEDQAFPFEDKAIEFYQTNLARIAQGSYDDWIQRSLNELSSLFPARYGREPQLEISVEKL